MPKSLLSLSLAMALAGCAVEPSASEEPGSPERTSNAALTMQSATFPVLPSTPPGNASRDQICASDAAQAKAAWRGWLAQKGIPQGGWVTDGNHHTCRGCYIDEVVAGWPEETFDIEDSYVNEGLFQSYSSGKAGAHFNLKNVYAFGAEVDAGVVLSAENTDLRCGWIRKGVLIEKSKTLDISGTDSPLLTIQSSSDVRISGIESRPGYEGVTLHDVGGARVQTSLPVVLGGTLSGTWAFDGASSLDLRAEDKTKLEGVTLSLAGATGKLSIANAAVAMTGGAVVGSDGRFQVLDLAKGSLRVMGGAAWPVGRTAIVPDASIAAVDLTGAKLVVAKGEAWPAEAANLKGLRLTHGALPDGADLTRAQLADAHLERVDLRNVTLSKLVGGKVVAADLSNTHLAQAVMSQQAIEGVSFVHADLRGAKLVGVHGKADFTAAVAGVLPPHTDDNDSDAPKITSFEQANLLDSIFHAAQLQSASFTHATLADVRFDGATNLANADFSSTSFTRTTAAGDRVANTTFGSVLQMHGVKLDAADLRGVDLHGVDFGPSNGARSSLIGTFLCGAVLTNAKLGGVDLTSAYLDVSGTITLPDGTSGLCAPAKRDGASTAPPAGLTTDCPSGGPGKSDGGACTEAQLKIQGAAPQTCTDPGTTMDGFPCALDCECQSNHCGSNGKCG